MEHAQKREELLRLKNLRNKKGLNVLHQVAKPRRCMVNVVPNTRATRGVAGKLRDADRCSETDEELDSGHHGQPGPST